MSNPRYHNHTYRKLREKILIRDNHTCYYCGQEANTVDHLIPISKGGIDSEDNLITACIRCNSSKRDRIAPGSFLPNAARPSTPVGNFLPGETQVRVHYA